MEEMTESPVDLDFESMVLPIMERNIKNFMEDLPNEVSFRRPSIPELWAFWSEPTLSPCSGGSITDLNQANITDKIKSALLHFGESYFMEEVLIQFWAPITTETGCVQLVTSDQPFALSYYFNEVLLKYRKQCLHYKINVDGDGDGDGEEVEGLGIPGRVFRQKWHECIPHVRFYSTKEYPQRDFPRTCDISASFCFPVFQTPFQEECVGVLEFASTRDEFDEFYYSCTGLLRDKFKIADLKTSLGDGLICEVLNRDDHLNIRAEIREGLEVVCRTYKLPFAKTWIQCGHFNGLAFHHECQASYVLDDNLWGFVYKWNVCQRGHGVVGRAYQSHKPYFCRDITQLSITEYPSLPLARYFGLTGCFLICLQSTCAKNYDYIIEFFLNPKYTYGEDPSIFLWPILETIKQRFPNFKLAFGEELGKELSIEVIKPRMNQEPTSFQCQSTSSPSNRPGVLQNGQEMIQPHSSNQQIIFEVDIDNGWNLVDAEQNNIPVSCLDEGHMNQELPTFQYQSTRSPLGLGVLHDGQETLQPHSSIQQPTDEVEVDINSGRNVDAEQNNTPGSSSNGEHPPFTREALKKYSGMKRKDVAPIFKMSESTFKCRLRKIGIKRWPNGRGKKKVEGSPSRREPPCSNAHMTPLVRPPVKRKKVNDPPSRQDPSSSDMPARTTPVVTPPLEVRTVIIMARYGDDMLKFKLSSSSGMVELEKEVTKRLKFEAGTYKITYNDGKYEKILIACDDDVKECMSAINSQDTIELLIERITQISPST